MYDIYCVDASMHSRINISIISTQRSSCPTIMLACKVRGLAHHDMSTRKYIHYKCCNSINITHYKCIYITNVVTV